MRHAPWISLRRLGLCALLALAWTGWTAPPAQAVLELDITEGIVEPLPIAISELYGPTPIAQQRGREIADVVSADLERSGLFRPIDRRAFIQSPDELRGLPRFADWRQINAQALVSGTVAGGEEGGDLEVEFRLWDVFAGTQMRGLRFATSTDNWRRVAHQIADAVYTRITGEEPYFDTRIVYVSESGPRTDRVKRIAIMDQDGANHRFLTDGANLVLTPRFHPDAARVAYMVYRGRVPQVYLRALGGGQEQKLGDIAGMTFAPHFSRDGRLIAMSLAEGGNSDIYSLDLESRV
jgi:TolB protein